jgi:hypothetical protein
LARLWLEFGTYYADLDPERFKAPSATQRRKGVATGLIRALENWGRSEGAEIVLAETDINSPAAIPFWDNAEGYARTSVRFRKRL